MVQSFVLLRVFGLKHPGVVFRGIVRAYSNILDNVVSDDTWSFEDVSTEEWLAAERSFVARLGNTVTDVFLAYGDAEECGVTDGEIQRMFGKLAHWTYQSEGWVRIRGRLDASFGVAAGWDTEDHLTMLYGLLSADNSVAVVQPYRPQQSLY